MAKTNGDTDMTFNTRIALTLLAIALCLAGPATAGPFEDATEASSRGDFATALQLWRPLAEQGNAAAQINLGNLYYSGAGLPQDYAEAAKWFSKAAAQGNSAAEYDLVAAKMTPAQITEAQRLAREWKSQ